MSDLPPNVTPFIDRHGKTRYRFRRKGWKSVFIKGEPIPADRFQGLSGTCAFCHGPKHYGWCDPMREARQRAIEQGRGRPVPITRC